MKPRYVEVIPLTGIGLCLHYLPPIRKEEALQIGQLVRIPLQNRSILAMVRRLLDTTDVEQKRLKHIYDIVYETPIMLEETLRLADWLQRYYGAPMDAVFETMIPKAMRKGGKHKLVRLLEVDGQLSEQEWQQLQKRSPKQAKLYGFLRDQLKPLPRSTVLSRLNVSADSCNRLIELGVLKQTDRKEMREAYRDELGQQEEEQDRTVLAQHISLNTEQEAAVDDVARNLDAKGFHTHLLHGVTGSGKTEVYLRAIQKTIAEGGGVIFLVPEVALTPQTVSRLRSRLETTGTKTIVWHSMLSEGERFDGWMALASGEARIVVGARSAIFAPVHDLRLVVVDEEHEPAYKQGEVPRYHGRDVAVYRAMLAEAVCILGSATPSLESLYNVQHERYRLNRLTKRVDDRQLPRIRLIDMRSELLRKRMSVTLSEELFGALRDRYEKKEQSILFLNRRGYSTSMMCPDCGYVAMSPDSSVSLTYHRTEEKLKCHLTGYEEPAPDRCPSCRSEKIKWRGFGTQKVEDILSKGLPKAVIKRIDADTMSKKHAFRNLLNDFKKGKIDILLGTQMIAKGLDFPNVTLVGLIDADLSLHMPDFRASERTFQLLVQVAGRAGRGDRAGEVYVQSYLPSSDPIQYARRQDFEGFLDAELEQRREFNYPPYRHIIRHLFRCRNISKLEFYLDKWVKEVELHLGDQLEIRGPAPAPLERLKGYYRFHLWYFTSRVSRIMPRLLELKEAFPLDSDIIDVFDVDPVDMR